MTSVAWLLVACGDDDGRTEPTADARPPDSEPPADGGDLDGGDAGRRPNDPVVDPLIEPLERLRAASRDPVAITLERGFPTGILGRFPTTGSARVERARSFLDAYGDVFSQGDALTLGVRRSAAFTAPGGASFERVVFHQSYRGVPVDGAELTVLLDGDEVVATMGRLLTGDVSLDTIPGLGPADAIRLANEAHPPTDGIVIGRPELVVHDRSLVGARALGAPRLAWRVNIDFTVHWIDAHTGDVIRTSDGARSAFEIEVYEIYRGSDDLGFDVFLDRLVWVGGECIVGGGLECGRVGNLVETFRDAYDLYQGFGWDSYDGNDGTLDVYWPSFHGDEGGAGYREVNFDEEFHFAEGPVGPDIVGHEYTHGVIEHSSDLDDSDETGALHESLADVMGNIVEGALGPVGEESSWGVQRDMCDPSRHGDPDHYSGYLDIDVDDGGVHSNAGIPNRAWCDMAEQLEAVGRSRDQIHAVLAELAFTAIQTLPSNASFQAARVATIWAAMQLGELGAEPFGYACLVARAWESVGVESSLADLAVVLGCMATERDRDADYVIDDADNCPDDANPSQSDHDTDGIGDACDDDRDNDGVGDDFDNCPDTPNPDQADHQDEDPGGVLWEKEYLGDACDPDLDDDDVLDEHDNCPEVANEEQDDDDDDGIGDACEPDYDGDGVRDDGDNCPFVANPPSGREGQADMDRDGLGDACDECPLDVDEVSAYTAGVPALGIAPSPLTPDSDEDGTPDSCDETPFGNGTQVDGGRPTDAALRPGTSSVRIDATVERGGAAWLPLDPCGGRCAGDWDERTFVILSFESLTPETRAAVLDDRGRVAAATSRHGSRRLQFRPRGGRRYALWLAPQPDRAGAISAVLSIDLGDAIRPEPDDACHGRANGLPCRISDLQAGICIDDACEPARCGDGFVTGTEECEDLNDASGDGCEPGTCQRSCELDSECDDGQACDGIETCSPVLFLCLAGRPLDEGTPCTLTAGGAGTCRSGTCATGGCGNGAPDPGEQCDDGDTMDGDGCDNDCTYSCTTTADCDDGNPCNGMESCFEASHSCIVGRPPDCADANACTADACSPAMPGGCTHVPVDADGDGASPTSLGACGTDCDDTSAAIHPGATEVCNGVDDDCDGMIDDVSRTCERDMDGDRFADETMTMTACECPAGWIEPNPRDPPDCADWRADVYPGAEAFHDTYYCDSPSVTSCPQSYDYDCNNFEQPENATVSTGCVVSGVGCAGGGWEGGVPACGTDGTQISCLRIGMLCTPFRTTVRLRCR